MKPDKIKEFQDRGLLFTNEEIEHILNEVKKVGFKVEPYLVKEKVFVLDKTKPYGELHLTHLKSNNSVTLNSGEIKFLRLNIFKDSIIDIILCCLFKEIDDQNYVNNYDPS